MSRSTDRTSAAPKTSALSRAIHGALLGAALATPAVMLVGVAPAMAESRTEAAFDIPAGSLDAALTQFAATAGITVSFDPAHARGLKSPGLRGRYDVDAGLRQLLAGSRLQVVRQANGSYSLLPAVSDGSLQLDSTSINSTAVESAWGPVDGYVATRSATATKTDTPILEIPQAINVVTAEQVQNQGARNLTQALRYTPGLSTGGFTDRNAIADEITSRGFAPTPLYFDGAYVPYAGSLGGAPQIDPYTLERIEVLKGPSSVLFGQNQPGGLINLVSKRPTREARNQIKLGAGSYNRVNGAFDSSGPLDEQGAFSYRLIGLSSKGNDQVDHTHAERLLLAPSLTWTPNDSTSLTLLAQVQRDDGLADYQSLPRIGSLDRGPNGERIDRNFFSGDSHYNDYKRNQYIAGYDFSHAFSDDLSFRSTARYTDVRDRYKGFYLRSFVTDANNVTDYTQANRVKLDWRQHNIAYTVDNNLEYKFATGALQHTTLTGVDYRHFTRQYDGYNAYNVLPVNLYGKNNFDSSSVTPVLDTQWDNTVRQTGLYFQDQIRLDQWILTVGGRQDWAEIDNKDLLAHSIASQRDNKFTGRVGLTYVTEFGLAPYVSYSQSFLPTIGTAAPERGGKAFEPTEGEQYEVGLKYQPLEKTLITASVFQVKQKNVLTGDTEYPQYQAQSGEVRSRGVELEVKSSIDNIDVLAAATYIDSFYTKSTYGDQGNRNESQAPVSASLWADYHFTGVGVDGLTVGAGARYTGRKPGDSANSFDVPAWVVYDATVRYDLSRFDPSLRGLQASLNVQNLFDREYVSDCNYSFGCYYGQERVASVQMTYDW
ncbi:TonB-dependent siderophore receptor [Pseudomonas sp. 5P_5.1_Bac1]|uniref:TonB-dependent siderophore receptor n=1 Tax=Pseudomonas sp. 5P_5.1_Bac1 TaxID=2971616 RepID=UPI0021C5CA0E|nr:TonB-dependent siderophore receptor [Pseudomonas sp. 5P_5.1_Bac1]MCU1725080.1 TonB-dependent siderophore receptor [Pseudomonas sp. 5P_5.1_Bac1]